MSAKKNATSEPPQVERLLDDLVGQNAVETFFLECGIPPEVIPNLLAECNVGSDWRAWQAVANKWFAANGGGRIYGHNTANKDREPPHKSLDDVLQCLHKWRQILAGSEQGLFFMGRSGIRDCLWSIRAMGLIPPGLSMDWEHGNAETVRQAIDRISEWATAAGNSANQTETKQKRGRLPHQYQKQRADFAKELFETEQLSWPKIADKYVELHPEDANVNGDTMRHAYTQVFGKQ